ncbi:hypothetical protein [Microcoleus vaginatus]|uniref:hypothetical protein n=1 Tax=Microcoleus vaginatus TaxID=119532 RepID=UPI001682C2F2|nr:hypothetical protein [Microcoleus sp. FACHB-84]MBD2010719.1 hypothetical protein [Microcoleus sp. FACHB-45]
MQKTRFPTLVILEDFTGQAAANSKTIIDRSPPQSRDLRKRHPETGFLPQTSRF